jgi:hypothetical protein
MSDNTRKLMTVTYDGSGCGAVVLHANGKRYSWSLSSASLEEVLALARAVHEYGGPSVEDAPK